MHDMKILQHHSCSNADSRCKKHINLKTNELTCRVTKQKGDIEATFYETPINKVHDDATVDILREIKGDEFIRYDHLNKLEWNPKRAGKKNMQDFCIIYL